MQGWGQGVVGRVAAAVLFGAVSVAVAGCGANLGASSATQSDASIESVKRARDETAVALQAYLADYPQTGSDEFLLEVQQRYMRLKVAYLSWSNAAQDASFPESPEDGLPSRQTALAYLSAFGEWLDAEGRLVEGMVDCQTGPPAAFDGCIDSLSAVADTGAYRERMLAAGRAFDNEAAQQ